MVFETTAYADSAIKPTSLLDHTKGDPKWVCCSGSAVAAAKQWRDWLTKAEGDTNSAPICNDSTGIALQRAFATPAVISTTHSGLSNLRFPLYCENMYIGSLQLCSSAKKLGTRSWPHIFFPARWGCLRKWAFLVSM